MIIGLGNTLHPKTWKLAQYCYQLFQFYSEQVYDYDLWGSYRQGLHRVVDKGDRSVLGLYFSIRWHIYLCCTCWKIWMGDHRQVVLYRARASLHTPCHTLKQYWIKYGSFRTRFDDQV